MDGNDETIITIIIHVVKANNNKYKYEKYGWHKWPTNGCIGRSAAYFAQKMANGQLLFCILDGWVLIIANQEIV